jgi:hypothetical protein
VEKLLICLFTEFWMVGATALRILHRFPWMFSGAERIEKGWGAGVATEKEGA